MKALLHRRTTPSYYAGEGNWTAQRSAALDFGSAAQAVHCARREGLADAEIIIVYQSIQDEVRVPLLPLAFSFPAEAEAALVGSPEAA